MQSAGGLTRNKNLWVLMATLAALFFAGLALFVLLYRWDKGVPRVDLPQAIGVTENRPTFKGVMEGVQRPISVAASPDGKRVYAAESDGQRAVRILNRDGQELGTVVPPGTDVPTRQPLSVAVGLDGTVYVADGAADKVLKFDPDGEYVGEVPPPDDTQWAPMAVAVDSGGNLYVAETMDIPGKVRHRVVIFDSQDRFLRAFGSKGDEDSGMNYPHAVAVDSQGRIYVSTIDAVKAFDAQGSFLFAFGGGGAAAPGLPMGLAIRDDQLYVVDATNHRVLVYDVSGESPGVPYTLGEFGTDSGELRFPQGVWPAADGRVYVADRDNNRVSVWSY